MSTEEPSHHRWLILIIAWLTAFTCALTINCYPPLLDEMMEGLGMTIPQAGLLMSITTLTQMSFTFVGGILADRYGTKRTMGTGITIMALSQVASGLANTFPLQAASRLLIGVGGGVSIVCAIKSLSEWFPSKELAMAASIQAMGWAIGNTVGLAASIPLSHLLGMGWKGAFLAFGALAMGDVFVFLKLGKEREPSPTEIERRTINRAGGFSEMLKVRELWTITIGIAGAWSGSSIVMTWLPKSLIDAGWGELSASLLATTIPLVGIIANPTGGVASDRLGLRKPLIALSGIFLCVSYGLLSIATQGILIWIAAVMSGWFSYLFVGPLLAIPAELPEIGHEKSGTFFGL
ncbi:MAG: CynX/NimT family MFS transporter, partial [Candidatus Bathyarchaeia archaeon]